MDLANGADCELLAAIEYKVASEGLEGVSFVLAVLTDSVNRHLGSRRNA